MRFGAEGFYVCEDLGELENRDGSVYVCARHSSITEDLTGNVDRSAHFTTRWCMFRISTGSVTFNFTLFWWAFWLIEDLIEAQSWQMHIPPHFLNSCILSTLSQMILTVPTVGIVLLK